MKNLTKLEMLFVRACKSKNAKLRLNSVYRRFYCKGIKYPEQYIVNILSRLCEEHNLLTITQLLDKLSTNNRWKYSDSCVNIDNPVAYNNLILEIIISTIRLSEISKFEGFISPAIFRHYRF
jgi:hypothetical protein